MADDYEVLQEIDKVEQYLREQDYLESIQSITMVYKSIHQMYNGNAKDAYKMPEDKATFLKYRRLADKAGSITDKVLLSKDKKIARISTQAQDIGADRIKAKGEELAQWIEYGVSPRATIALDRCAKAHAFINGKEFVTPDDIHAVIHDVFRHRLLISFEAEAQGISSDQVINLLLDKVAIV